MKSLLAFGIVVLINYIGDTAAEDPVKVKLVDYKADYINNSYIDTKNLVLKVIKVNETYNRMDAKITILKDFPLDSRADVNILRSPSCRGPWENIEKFTSHFCDSNDKYRKFLPRSELIDQIKEGKCVQKGKYEFYDDGSFRVNNLLPGNEVRGYYYLKKVLLGNDEIKISKTTKLYQSDELSPCSL